MITVGLATYKMDATGRTLVRVSEPATPGAVTLPATTPRRASVNGRTFVRQGTSDRLVIDPTSVRKTLASGRLKWSLQNARRRKASQAETLCPYFTKYGEARWVCLQSSAKRTRSTCVSFQGAGSSVSWLLPVAENLKEAKCSAAGMLQPNCSAPLFARLVSI